MRLKLPYLILYRQLSGSHRESVGNNLMYTGRGWSSSFDSEMEDTVDAMSPAKPHSLPVNRPKGEITVQTGLFLKTV